jgi:diguanylate cyclase (GGDEF)-like protein/PAS domain S-box-containing protein
MPLQAHPYSALLAITAIVAAINEVIAWNRRSAPGARPLSLINLAAAFWALTYALMWASTKLRAEIFWLNATYFGVVVIPTAYLVFVLQFSGNENWLTPRRLALLCIEPLLTVIIVWTNPYHHLFYLSFSQVEIDPFITLQWVRGPWFWVNVVYSYPLLLVAFIILLRSFLSAQGPYRWQAGITLAGSFIPWAANIYTETGLSPFGNLDLTPIAFSLMGLMFALALLRFRLFDLVPIARSLIVERMSDGIVVLDRLNRVIDINPTARELTGFRDSFIDKVAGDVFSAWPDMIDLHRVLYAAHAEIRTTGNPGRFVDLQIDPIHDRRNRFLGRVIILRDITARKIFEQDLQEKYTVIQELQAKLREQAIRDPLTELYNRRYMEDALERELAKAARENVPLTAIILDLDHFKLINDSYGHEAGDIVLKALALFLLAEARKTDIVCRYGGEEFVVIMPGAGLEMAHERVEAWRAKFQDSNVPYQDMDLKCTFSAGLASFPIFGTTAKSLFTAADQALYIAKQTGRNRVVVPDLS